MNQDITPETLYSIIQTLCADDYHELLKKMQLNQKMIWYYVSKGHQFSVLQVLTLIDPLNTLRLRNKYLCSY